MTLVKVATEDSILDEYKLANDLIADIKKLSMDYPTQKEHFTVAINQLNEMKEKRLDQLTLEFMKQPKNYLDPMSDDLTHTFDDEKGILVIFFCENFSLFAFRFFHNYNSY